MHVIGCKSFAVRLLAGGTEMGKHHLAKSYPAIHLVSRIRYGLIQSIPHCASAQRYSARR
ncbi:hypothetical protein GCM10022212_19710 [Actimicrobium antarcticum]|uniref:Uncharacterized protein n=1 Tax=Actimicrobium antarcticum TaxID=1051899 RepID=A0ABP7T8A9_9BURK